MKASARVRRTAAAAAAVVAAAVVFHYAYGMPQLFHWAAPRSSASVSLTGDVIALGTHSLQVEMVGSKGMLSGVQRTVAWSPQTRFGYPGQPTETAAQGGLRYLRVGYRVQIQGLAAGARPLTATAVTVSFPPVQGTIADLAPGWLAVRVGSAPEPLPVQLTSQTTISVPDGQWSLFKPGALVRIAAAPTLSGSPALQLTPLTALSVTVLPPASGTKSAAPNN